MKLTRIGFLVVLTVLVVTAPVSAGDVIANGVDLWFTPADGGTFVNFAADPIPSGFFCTGSKPFAEKVTFKGVPIPTEPKGVFGLADTIVQRLDDAVFSGRSGATRFHQNVDGMVDLPVAAAEVASTRVQVRAISFASIEPIRTDCGLFNVTARLAPGDQPITTMTITRENDFGGRFFAPLSLNVSLSFSPAKGPARETLEIARRVDFPGKANAFWSDQPGESGIQHLGVAQVDTTGDGSPDTFVPGTSNFAAGWNNGVAQRLPGDLQTASDGIAYTPYCNSIEVTYYGETHCHSNVVVEEPRTEVAY